MVETLQTWVASLAIPPLTIVGIMALCGLLFGKLAGVIKLPSIIGYLIIGVLIGPSLLGLLDEQASSSLGFLTDVALGFVAISIGLELKLRTLRNLGGGIVAVILAESLTASVFVTLAVYLVSRDLPLGILFGALAPASAPAGTVAVIQEYRAKGTLTQALYAVVGFDDALGIIIFGFAAAAARVMVTGDGGAAGMILMPLRDIGLSIVVGVGIAFLYGVALRMLKHTRDVFILTFGVVLLAIGVCEAIGTSLIFTNLVIGIFAVNTLDEKSSSRIGEGLKQVMPLLFVLFFVLAGANLHVNALPSLGLIGGAYIVARSGGKIAGAWFGALIGKTERKIRNLTGLGILSQAGVAIGLALVVKDQFGELGAWGAEAGAIVLTTITATSIVFEIIGPLLAKVALKRAGEIPESRRS